MSDTTSDYGVSLLPVADYLAQAANANGSVLPYKHLFANNSALIGGALYLATTDEVTFSTSMLQTVTLPGLLNATLITMGYQFVGSIPSRRVSIYYPPLSVRYQFSPGILMYGNTASGGGALYLEGNGKVRGFGGMRACAAWHGWQRRSCKSRCSTPWLHAFGTCQAVCCTASWLLPRRWISRTSALPGTLHCPSLWLPTTRD